MARNEPLAGGQMVGGGTGGALPGSSGNGGEVGYSFGGAADSESMYLVEGQDTENISGGASQANAPFELIQEVQIKTSGIEAEHGGAVGGVINVIMKKGGNDFHGSPFVTYESDKMDGTSNLINHDTLRYDPLGAPSTTSPFLIRLRKSYGGSTGHNSPDTTRAFDEPFYYYTYQGKLNSIADHCRPIVPIPSKAISIMSCLGSA
jgi:hypothetical protein